MADNPYESPRNDRKRGWDWKAVVPDSPLRGRWAPLISLIAGPSIGAVYWGIDVFIIRRDYYVSSYERFENLPIILALGFVVGVGVVGVLVIGTLLRPR